MQGDKREQQRSSEDGAKQSEKGRQRSKKSVGEEEMPRKINARGGQRQREGIEEDHGQTGGGMRDMRQKHEKIQHSLYRVRCALELQHQLPDPPSRPGFPTCAYILRFFYSASSSFITSLRRRFRVRARAIISYRFCSHRLAPESPIPSD